MGVIAPDTGATRLLGAGIVSWRVGVSVLLLAIVCGRAEVNEELTFRRDQERMRRMIAGNGQPRDDRLASAFGCDLGPGDGVAQDAVVDLGVDHTFVECDAGAAVPAARDRFTEPLDDVRVPVATCVLQ